MTEWLESGINKYCLRDRFTDKDETWELWQGFREIAMLRYKTGPEIIDFNGEWLGWGRPDSEAVPGGPDSCAG